LWNRVTRIVGEFDNLADDELERAIVERLSALGLLPDAASDTRH